MSATEFLGVLGGIVTCSAVLPQIYKSYKYQRTRDLSWAMFWIFYVGCTMNIVYGILIHHPAVSFAALYSFLTNTTLVGIKYYYEIHIPGVVPPPCTELTEVTVL